MSAHTQMFLSLLTWIYQFVGDYGWSIVVFTLLFRALIFPLDFYQKRAMKRQTDLNPKVAALNKKYANDKDKLNQKTMELYREAKVNPLAGCLPLLIQLPIFFAFFAAIRTISEQQTYELYSQALALGGANVTPTSWYWIHNLWQPDTFTATVIPAFNMVQSFPAFANVTDYDTVMAPIIAQFEGFRNGWAILPILAGGTSLLQSWLMSKNNPPPDPNAKQTGTQKMMKYLFPIMSIFFCWTSSAAFSLYWTASNVGSMLSQLLADYILKRKDKAKAVEQGELAK